MKKIAIIGAGFTGSYLASRLKDSYQVTVFEKARGVGGRMSTRYTDEYEFDHGVPFFHASDAKFKDFLKSLVTAQVISPYWRENYYLSIPRMNQVLKYLLKDVEIKCQTRIEKMQAKHQEWHLYDDQEQFQGCFDWVISTAPAQQTEALFSQEVSFFHQLSSLYLKPQYVLMLGLKDATFSLEPVLDIHDGIIELLVNNSSKPKRPQTSSWLVYADKIWSEKHLEDNNQEVEQALLLQALKYLKIKPQDISYQSLHRWRYAQSTHTLKQPKVFIDSHLQCAACGDWSFNGDVESAYLSAEALLNRLTPLTP